jgi:D-threo-aldose 1-dehydrogenase
MSPVRRTLASRVALFAAQVGDPRSGAASPLRSSPIGLGTAAIGHLYEAVSDEQAFATLQEAWDLGIRYFDTAPLYGNGLAEFRLGRFLAGKDRSSYAVSSKVGRVLDGGTTTGEPGHDYSARGVRQSLEGTLARLGLDKLDLVLVHDPDLHWTAARDEALPELTRLREEGLVGAVGVGMNQAEMLHRFVLETEVDCILVAGRYTLLDRRADQSLLPACLDRGIAVIVGGVFNGGILADPSENARFDYRPASSSLRGRVLALRAVCDSFGVPLAAAALQFSLAHAAIVTAVIGVRSPDEVREDFGLLSVDIPVELWGAIDATVGRAGASASAHSETFRRSGDLP